MARMRGPAALLFCGLISMLSACGSTSGAGGGGDDAAAATSSAATTEAPLRGRKVRFEIAATVSITKGGRVEIAMPVAHDEAGVQVIEKFDVSVTPSVKYEITPDGHGNRLLRVANRGPLTVRVSYRVLRGELRTDLEKAEKRPLTDSEKSALAQELRPTGDPSLDVHRSAGTPSRRVLGARVEGFADGPAEEYDWVEIYRPGLTWIPWERMEDGFREEFSVLPGDVLVILRGGDTPLAVATVDGVKAAVPVAFTGKLLDAP